MYKHNSKQLEFEDFALPFSGGLRSDNRWIKIAKFIPWDEFELFYSKSLSGSQMGSPALSVRIAIGSLIIKERLGTSDEETNRRADPGKSLSAIFSGLQGIQR